MSSIMKFSKFALKNLFSKPATEKYPFEERKFADRYRGKVDIKIDDCLMCGLCARKCPSGAITVNRETKTWTIDRMGCVQCSNCVNSCPKKCLTMEQHYSQPSATKTVDSYVQPAKEEAASAKGDKPQTNTI